jgi:hypothetical protein
MPGSLRIHLYCLCWNDARMLPYFFRHYDELVDEYYVYDNGSTDASLSILANHGRVQVSHFDVPGDSFVDEERRLGDLIWQRSKGKADWVIVTDIDEHIFHEDLIGYLAQCREDGITAIETLGYEMVADSFPTQEEKLTNLITNGCRSHGHDRLCIFNPDAIVATNFSPGRHEAEPEGAVIWPSEADVLLLHYKQLGADYAVDRSAELRRGIKPGDIDRGWALHYTWSPAKITAKWAELKAGSSPVPGLTGPRLSPFADYGEDQKIIEESGLLDVDWYLATYPDVATIEPLDPLSHFCTHGWQEGRQPNFYFDSTWYSDTYGLGSTSDRNPLVHYVIQGESEGAWPSPHFDPGWYRDQHDLEPDESPLRHFLLRRTSGLVTPLPDFDVESYCSSNPEILDEGRDPYEDYIARSEAVPDEHAPEYPSFAEVAATIGVDADADLFPAGVPWASFLEVIHLFLQHVPVDEDWYCETYEDVDDAIRSGAIPSARDHFIEYGYFEGRTPSVSRRGDPL